LQIGSLACFEYGPFEFARLRGPSSIVFDLKRRCLHIADCEVLLAFDCPKHFRKHLTLASWKQARGVSELLKVQNGTSVFIAVVSRLHWGFFLSIF